MRLQPAGKCSALRMEFADYKHIIAYLRDRILPTDDDESCKIIKPRTTGATI